MGFGPTQRKVLDVLSDGKPRSHRSVVREGRLGYRAVEAVLKRLWELGILLRTLNPVREHQTVFKGKAGISRNLRSYHLYVLRPKGIDLLTLDGRRFVKFDKKRDRPKSVGTSKAKLVLGLVREVAEKAFYSKEIVESLRGRGVKPSDVMPNVRRFEKGGLVFVRGYRTDLRETPFKDGYLITWIDQEKPRDKALEEAVERTSKVLESNPWRPLIFSF